jgi:alanine racemase
MAQALQHKHRLWAEIDLDKLASNYHTAQGKTGGKLMPVIKADAYGHGAVPVALRLNAEGADFFAVATPEEALQLRRHGIDCDILLLGLAPDSHLPALIGAKVTLCVPDIQTARRYQRVPSAAPPDVHIKINTGMTRLGLPADSAADGVLEIARGLNVTGLFTHFAAADEEGQDGFTKNQYDTFMSVCHQLRAKGMDTPILHAANSAALLRLPYTRLDYARPGLMLYGYGDKSLSPVLSLYTSVMQLHSVPEGTTVSYGRTWEAKRQTTVATIPVGYADGLSWSLSGSGAAFIVNGLKAPLIGRVCMDFCALDVTDIPSAAQGGPVTVLGEGIDASEHARLSGTITWEVLCSVGRRVPRVYVSGGKVVEEINDVDLL